MRLWLLLLVGDCIGERMLVSVGDDEQLVMFHTALWVGWSTICEESWIENEYTAAEEDTADNA